MIPFRSNLTSILEEPVHPQPLRMQTRSRTRRVSNLPVPLSTGTKSNRKSMLPLSTPKSKAKKTALSDTENTDLNTPKNHSDLSMELDDIDIFLNDESSTPQGKSPLLGSNESTPRPRAAKKKHPIIRTSDQLRNYVSHSQRSSPSMTGVPFSPARARST